MRSKLVVPRTMLDQDMVDDIDDTEWSELSLGSSPSNRAIINWWRGWKILYITENERNCPSHCSEPVSSDNLPDDKYEWNQEYRIVHRILRPSLHYHGRKPHLGFARQGLSLSNVNELIFLVPLFGFRLTPVKQHDTTFSKLWEGVGARIFLRNISK